MISIFGKTPTERDKNADVEDDVSMSTNFPNFLTERDGNSSRFRKALESVQIPLHDRRVNPFKGNLKKQIAKFKKLDFTLDKLVDFDETFNADMTEASIVEENESQLDNAIKN